MFSDQWAHSSQSICSRCSRAASRHTQNGSRRFRKRLMVDLQEKTAQGIPPTGIRRSLFHPFRDQRFQFL